MATHNSYPGTISAGDAITAAHNNELCGGWIGYAEHTSSITGLTATLTALSGLTVTPTIGSSRRIRITGFIPRMDRQTANDRIKIYIAEDGNNIQTICQTSVAAGSSCTVYGGIIRTPSAGSHTYNLASVIVAGTADAVMGSGGDPGPGWILVEDLGPA